MSGITIRRVFAERTVRADAAHRLARQFVADIPPGEPAPLQGSLPQARLERRAVHVGHLRSAAGKRSLCPVLRWPQWLGPKRDAVWREAGLVDTMPAGGPPVRWRQPIGPGYSGPAVAGGRVYVMDRRAGPVP